MAEKDGDFAARVIGGAAAMVAGFAARKTLTIVWTRVTGKEPPNEPESPDITLGEALGWAVVTGVGIEVARILALRTAHKRLSAPHPESADRTR